MVWKKGQSGNPKGRKSKVKEVEYLEALRSAVSTQDVIDMVSTMIQFAKAGNVNAFKALAPYVLGNPEQNIDLTSGGESLTIRVVREARNVND